MPYTKSEAARITYLIKSIQAKKEHKYAAATYKDVPALKELAEAALRHDDGSFETTALYRFICECYDSMGRQGVSVKYHKALLLNYAKLHSIRALTAEEADALEDDFRKAVRARNCYEKDGCADLTEIIAPLLSDERLRPLAEFASQCTSRIIKYDPVEKTEAYLRVIDEVEELIDKNKRLDFCLETWKLKAKFLSERGIVWRSPVELNPLILFD